MLGPGALQCRHHPCGRRDDTLRMLPHRVEVGGKKKKGKKAGGKRKLRGIGGDRRGPKNFSRLLDDVSSVAGVRGVRAQVPWRSCPTIDLDSGPTLLYTGLWRHCSYA